MNKVKVTQDVLYQFLVEHNVNLSGIAREMQANPTLVAGCFKRNLDRHGKPRRFTPETLPRLNEAIDNFSARLRGNLIQFGSEQTFTNNWGKTYDPGVLPSLKTLSQYFNLTAFIIRVLGWNERKKNATMSAPSSPAYGCVSKNDVNRINAELLAVAGVLGNYEVVIEESKDNSNKGTHDKEDETSTPTADDLEAYEDELVLTD